MIASHNTHSGTFPPLCPVIDILGHFHPETGSMSKQKREGAGLGKFMRSQSSPAVPPGTSGDTEPSEGRATKSGKRQLLVYLQPEGIQALKIEAVKAGSSASAIMAEALNEWFQRRGLPPVA